MRAITADEVEAFRSSYLSGGYKEDTIALRHAAVGPDSIIGTYDVVENFLPSTGGFHFTLLLAFVAIAELGIIFGHVDNGLTAKTSEVLLTRLNIRCGRLVTATTDIPVRLSLTKRIVRDGAAFHWGDIDVYDRAFHGTAAFVLPLIEPEVK